MSLERAIRSDKTLRTVGFDDAPFERGTDAPVGLAGIVCKGTRFDGMLWGRVSPDGTSATDEIDRLLADSKFLPQLHAVLLDGIAFAGFNVVDLPALSERLALPCIAVMRDRPDFEAIESALQNVDDSERRLATIRQAGEVFPAADAFFQCAGCEAAVARRLVDRLSVTGHVPEPLRIAHLVASAVASGESGRRA